MLSILHSEVAERVQMGAFFEELGFASETPPSNDGDSILANEWAIDVLSQDGYERIEAFRWTKPEHMVNVRTTHTSITCSPEHLIELQTKTGGHWVYARNLQVQDAVTSLHGSCKVVDITDVEGLDRLCDLQVAHTHSFYANELLSHNSHFLVSEGAHAVMSGRNVMHYTFELSEAKTGIRYDSHICGIDSNDVLDRKSDVLMTYAERRPEMGRLIIKFEMPHVSSVYTIRAHLERQAANGFRPDIVIIDYADLMRSTRQFDSLRHELKLIYEELRALANELGIPILTASQSNKEGSSQDVIDITNMSESYGKAMTADTVISISRKTAEKAIGVGRLYVAKNRAGRDGILFPITIDTAQSRFEVMGDQISVADHEAQEQRSAKEKLKKHWSETKTEMVEGLTTRSIDVKAPVENRSADS